MNIEEIVNQLLSRADILTSQGFLATKQAVYIDSLFSFVGAVLLFCVVFTLCKIAYNKHVYLEKKLGRLSYSERNDIVVHKYILLMLASACFAISFMLIFQGFGYYIANDYYAMKVLIQTIK